LGILDRIFGEPKPQHERKPKRQRRRRTLDDELLAYVRSLKREDPGRYAKVMDKLAARKLQFGDEEDGGGGPDDPRTFLRRVRAYKELAEELGGGGDGESMLSLIKAVLENAPGVAEAALRLRGASPAFSSPSERSPLIPSAASPAQLPATPPNGAGQHSPPATPNLGQQFIAALNDKSPAEAAAFLANQTDAGLQTLVRALCEIPDGHHLAYLEERVLPAFPDLAPFVEWLRGREPWLTAMVGELRAYQAQRAMQPGPTGL